MAPAARCFLFGAAAFTYTPFRLAFERVKNFDTRIKTAIYSLLGKFSN